MTTFATEADYEECRRLHRAFGTTYYFASRFFSPVVRRRVDALYGFVRVPDEWVDNPGPLTVDEQYALLHDFQAQINAGFAGTCPSHPVLRAFVDTAQVSSIDPDEIALFLGAMRADISVTRYETYADLECYMRGSAAAVGLMMLSILGVNPDAETRKAAINLGNAMQLTNFIRDVGEDAQRGRIYLPLSDLCEFRVSEKELSGQNVSPALRELIEFQIGRARALYASSDDAIRRLPLSARRAVGAARLLYAAILDEVERNDYNVLTVRARTSRIRKLQVATRVVLGM